MDPKAGFASRNERLRHSRMSRSSSITDDRAYYLIRTENTSVLRCIQYSTAILMARSATLYLPVDLAGLHKCDNS